MKTKFPTPRSVVGVVRRTGRVQSGTSPNAHPGSNVLQAGTACAPLMTAPVPRAQRPVPTIAFKNSSDHTRSRAMQKTGIMPWLWVVLVFVIPSSLRAAPLEQFIRTNQPGQMITKEYGVEYIAAGRAPMTAPTNQWLNFHDALRTLDLGRATVRLLDWKHVYLRDRSKLEILPDGTMNGPTLHLLEGELYLSRGGGEVTIPVQAGGTRGVPQGTEFLVSVADGVATFTMFDGEVELSNSATPQPVRVTNGWQAIAAPGQAIRLQPILEARNIVQWWLYYPAVLDPRELALTPAEQNQLATSLDRYRAGHLSEALQRHPSFPNGPAPESDAAKTYLAALHLSAGAVERATQLLQAVDRRNAAVPQALELMIFAVTNGGMARTISPGEATQAGDAVRSVHRSAPIRPAAGGDRLGPVSDNSRSPGANEGTQTGVAHADSPSFALAQSYAHQSSNNLSAALTAARHAVTISPDFGFGWARVAELEFAFGHTRAAHEAVGRALQLSPENAQALCVHGFLLAANYRFLEALAAFDHAITLDAFLGNAWLGRGLVKRRIGFFAPAEPNKDKRTNEFSWLGDLQTAALVEPRRSLIRAYAGKSFSDIGHPDLARKEFDYAEQLDPNDPTPSLYRALELRTQNRPNEAVHELERSIALNDNRAVYRSRLLLDQDHAVRSASLAKIYQDAGLEDVALREAARAVSDDYSSHSAHQFLAESYNALRDPTRFNLRHETIWFNELLLANLLSPVGAGLLSQNISQQEYSSLFEHNRLGLLTSTEYRSDGQLHELASHHGQVDRLAYTLDLDYQHNEGTRLNHDLERKEWYSQFKYQLTHRDSLFLLTKYQDYESGDNAQHYDPADASRNFRFTEKQAPIALAAVHREWVPGAHTTLLAGRLESNIRGANGAQVLDLHTNAPNGDVNNLRQGSFSNSTDHAEFTAYIAELNHIWQRERRSTVIGSRIQGGSMAALNVIDGIGNTKDYYGLPLATQLDETFHRFSIYAYDRWSGLDRLQLTTGLAYEHFDYPENFRRGPLSDHRETRLAILPKAAAVWDIARGLTARGLYAQSLGGLSYDESIRLEPTQLAGFAQTFRDLMPPSETDSPIAPRYDTAGLSLDAKPGPSTFLSAQLLWHRADTEQEIGVFRSAGSTGNQSNSIAPFARPSTTKEDRHYTEAALALSLEQLVGREWSFTVGYVLSHARLRWSYPEIPDALDLSPDRVESALMHHWQARARYHHPSGFFAQLQAGVFWQDNDGYVDGINGKARPGDLVYQINTLAGWRLWRRRGELTLGCLNLTNQDYRLNPLNPYPDLPRERVWITRMQLNF